MSATPVAFRHTDSGTAESTWLGSPQWDAVPVLDLPTLVGRHPKVLVVSAHPDDETLGVGALVADLADAGATVDVLVATDGERSHPVGDGRARAALGAARRREVGLAVAGLAPGARVTHLGMPDGELDQHEPALVERLLGRIDARSLVLAPWVADGHADHDALGRACAAAVSLAGAAIAHFPVWLWHWGAPEALPWPDVVASESSLAAAWRKRAALEQFPSQTILWGFPDAVGGPAAAVLGAASLDRARRLVETLVDPAHVLPVVSPADLQGRVAARAAVFDEMYDGSGDPWGLASSFYEERRRALVLALLGWRRHGRALEIGCADGRLTEALVERCDEVVAVDTSHRAVAAARRRVPQARVEQGVVPGDLPAGPFDLVVLSEVGYFLTPLELVATLRRCEAMLAPGGELLLCHWQHPTTGIPLDGPLVHEQAASQLGLHRRAVYTDDDLEVVVWGDGPSPAVREGRG